MNNPTPRYQGNIDLSEYEDGIYTITCKLFSSTDESLLSSITKSFTLDRTIKPVYNAHVQMIGWQGEKYNGDIAGTSGLSYRIEA